MTLSPLGSTNLLPRRARAAADVALYRAEVDRIRRGEGYYQAAAAELTPRGYPTRSVFNWRTPLPMWLLGKLPASALGKALLGGLALLLMLMAFEALAREENPAISCQTPRDCGRGRETRLACAVALSADRPAAADVLDDLFVVPVLWAGVFVALSVCAYGMNRPWLGVALGLAAVFFRELALPYCLLGATIAWWHGRRGELAAWTLGLAAWLGLLRPGTGGKSPD